MKGSWVVSRPRLIVACCECGVFTYFKANTYYDGRGRGPYCVQCWIDGGAERRETPDCVDQVDCVKATVRDNGPRQTMQSCPAASKEAQ